MSASELKSGDRVTWSRAEMLPDKERGGSLLYNIDWHRWFQVAPFGTVVGPSEIIIELVEKDLDKIAEAEHAERTLWAVGDKRVNKEQASLREGYFLKVIAQFKVLVEEVELDGRP